METNNSKTDREEQDSKVKAPKEVLDKKVLEKRKASC